MKNKKGLSPVIASVMMVLLVIVLAGIVFLWSRGFISEQIEKFGKPVEQSCSEVQFEVVKRDNTLEVVNRGSVNIKSLDIKLSKRGSSEFKKFAFSIDSGEAVSQSVALRMSDGTVPDEIIVYPVLIGSVVGETSNKLFTCTDYGVEL